MELSDTKLGFPDLNGYLLSTHVKGDSPQSIMLWFYKPSEDISSMINIYVFLVDAQMEYANVIVTNSFPEIKSYSIKEGLFKGLQRSCLSIVFESGEMSFLFQKSFYIRSLQPLGKLPDDLKKKLK